MSMSASIPTEALKKQCSVEGGLTSPAELSSTLLLGSRSSHRWKRLQTLRCFAEHLTCTNQQTTGRLPLQCGITRGDWQHQDACLRTHMLTAALPATSWICRTSALAAVVHVFERRSAERDAQRQHMRCRTYTSAGCVSRDEHIRGNGQQ
jgi:hypothetical protein